MKLVTLQQASVLTKLSESDLKSRVKVGSLPAFTSKSGKILFDIDRLILALKDCNRNNLNSELEAEPIIDYVPYSSPENVEVTMASVDKLFGFVTKEDLELGRFGADTFAFRPTADEPTSETLNIEKTPQKP